MLFSSPIDTPMATSIHLAIMVEVEDLLTPSQ